MPTTYFVRKTGSDANAGTSAGAAWLTIGKALGASGISSGDTVYIGAGTYREVVTVAMTSAVATTSVIADVDGAQTGDSGRVIWTAYTTNDKSAPGQSPLILAGRDFLSFDGFYFMGGQGFGVDGTTAISTNCTFRRCVFNIASVGSGVGIRMTGSAGVALHLLIDQCVFAPTQNISCWLTLPTHSVDYDVDAIVQNCVFTGAAGTALYTDTSGALAGFPGGVLALNNTFIAAGPAMRLASASMSASILCQAKGNRCFGNSIGLQANAAGTLTEDYNLLLGSTARLNVTAGANSFATVNYAPLLDFGHSALIGRQPRPMLGPLAGDPALGFDPAAAGASYSTPTPPTTDHLQRPRPAGGQIIRAAGAYELHDTAVKETTTFDVTPSVKIAGPGDHDMLIPVNNAATTLTIKAQYDTNHAATNKPQVILQTNGEIGVATQTVTMTAAANTWETLTVGPFTPTAKGYVTLRLVSRSAAANGNAFFDTATVPNLNTDGFDYFRYGEPFPALTQNASGGGSTSIPGIIMATG